MSYDGPEKESQSLSACASGSRLIGRGNNVRGRLESKKLNLEAQLSKVNEAISILDSQPAMEKFFDLMNEAL